ncbi:MAG: hypothetical protein M3Y48_17025 [Actinomycetota bacterium]|nr:hypothetical protein [Actinomycetota bacterium]
MAFGRDFYAALGRLVFEASHLEHEVASLHAVAKTSGGVTANGEEEDDLPAVKTPRGVWRELDGGLNKLGSHDDLRESDRTAIDDCKAWVDEAKRLWESDIVGLMPFG